MRFKPHLRSEYLDTSRKRGNIERGQRKERDSLPLLADIIGEKQPSVDEVRGRCIT